MPEKLHAIETNYERAANARLDLYLLGAGDEAVLVDAGISTSPGDGVIDSISSVLDGQTLAAILITHAHVDHVGGASALREAFGARVLVPRDDVGWIEDPEYQWHAFWDTVADEFDIGANRDQILAWSGPPFVVDGLVRPDDRIRVGDEQIRAILTRAHTPGHTCYYAERSGTLFTGDFVQRWGSPSADGATAFPPLYDSVTAYIAGLRTLASVPFERLATAHRGILDRAQGMELLAESERFTEHVVQLTAGMAAGREGVTVTGLAAEIAALAGAAEPLSVQSVLTARAHLRHATSTRAIHPDSPHVWRA